MAVEANLTRVTAPAYDIDFVEQFGRQMKGLSDVFGISRMRAVPVGTTVKTYKSVVTLAGGEVDPGDIIPLSKVEKTPDATYEMAFDKRRKAVPAEDIQKVGYDNAVADTDEALLKELRGNVLANLYTQLNTGTGAVTGATLQATMAQAGGAVSVVFENDAIEKVAFINPMDLADYQATHQVTLETQNGVQYLKNFLGFDVVVVTSGVEQGTIISTASDNLNIVYADMGGEIKKGFPEFFSDSVAPMIGVAHHRDLSRLTAETTTLSGVMIFAERIDGIVIGTITAV